MDAASTPISRRELLTVDLRGMKSELIATARARGVSPSEFVRTTLAEAIDPSASSVATRPSAPPIGADRVRLSLRMARTEAVSTLAAARRAGLVPGAYVAGLIAGIPALTSGRSRDDHLATLIASNAELTTLGRQVRQLIRLLHHGSIREPRECRETVDCLAQGMRSHLAAASAVLADLRPRARGSERKPPA